MSPNGDGKGWVGGLRVVVVVVVVAGGREEIRYTEVCVFEGESEREMADRI